MGGNWKSATQQKQWNDQQILIRRKEENFHCILYIEIKWKIHMLEPRDRMMKVSSHRKEKAKKTPWIKQHVNKTSNWAASKGIKVTIPRMRKSSTEAENKNMVRTWWVTLTAQNTCDIWKEPGLFVYLCKIYTQLHMYIYVHIGTTVHMYMQPPHNCPLGASKKILQLCKKLQLCVWLPRRNGRKIRTNSQTAQTQTGFHPQGQLQNVPSSFAGIENPSEAVDCSSTHCNCFQTH